MSGDVKRSIVLIEYLKILKKEVASHDTHGVVGDAHLHAIGYAEDIGVIEIDLPIDVRLRERSFDAEVALPESAQSEDLIRNETVGQ